MSAKRLLVIDDEISACEVSGTSPAELSGYMSYYLQEMRDAGFDVTPAKGGDEALTILERDHAFDVVLVDVMMPQGKSLAGEDTARGMRTGLFLVRRIRELWPDLPLMILSNAVPSLPDAPQPTKYQGLIAQGIVSNVFFKPDMTPAALVEQIRLFLHK